MQNRTGTSRPTLSRQQGFTLVELISVVIILGILAAYIVPRYFEMVNKSVETTHATAASEGVSRFTLAFQKYIVDTGKRPSSLTELSGSAYLNLNADGRAVLGDYDVDYTLVDSTVTMRTYTHGDASSLLTKNLSWP